MDIIIWGSNYHLGKSFFVEDCCCPYCEHYDCIELFMVSNYAHMFYIPYLPVDKSGLALCSHCGRKIIEVNFSKKLREKFKEELKIYHHPLKMYTGFIILPGAFIVAIIVGYVWEHYIKYW